MIPNVEMAKRNGAPGSFGHDPAEVAELLNDAKAALRSDPTFATGCIARALELLHVDIAPVVFPSTFPKGGLAGWQVRRVADYIDVHLESTIRVKDLATLTRLSTSHFSRAFKRSFGQSPMAFISGRRVALAQRLMLATEDSMCQIALACGMCDQAHLTRAFRRVVGESPMAWRRQYAVGPPPRPATSRETWCRS
jgi:AraC-like DNA-binding protein